MIFLDERRAGAFVSPAGSVGASATQRCQPDTRTLHRPVPKCTFKLQRVAVGSDPYMHNHIGYIYNRIADP